MDKWTLLLQTINAVILIGILSRFLFRPISNMITERQSIAHSLISQAQHEKELAESARQQAELLLDAVALERERTLKTAAEQVRMMRHEGHELVKQDEMKIREQRQRDLARQKSEILLHAQTCATELALELTRKVLKRVPGLDHTNEYIDDLIDGLNALPQSTRQRLGADGDTISLISASHLSEQARHGYEKRVVSALGHNASMNWVVDPDLIAGLELQGRHCSVRNSVRADINTLSAELRDE